MAPDNVSTVCIREVAAINAHSLSAENAPSQIEYIDISSVGRGELSEKPVRMAFADAPSRARRLVSAGDTIISTVRPNRRSFLYVASPTPETVVSTGFAVLTPTPRVEARYLYYWVTRREFSDYLSLHAKGAAYPAVAPEDIGAAEIVLPPLPVQQKIAGILSAYDELIENCQRRIRILEEMARKLYREWFVNFRFPGHENIKMVSSKIGEIPEGWEVNSLPSCVQFNPRVSIPRDGEKTFVAMRCLSSDSMIITNVESRTGNSGAKFQNGDTLVARITPCLENGKTGFVQFLPDFDCGAFGSTEFMVLRSLTLSPELVYCIARSNEFRNVAMKSMTGATGRQRVDERCFAEFLIAKPSHDLIEKFTMVVRPIFQTIHRIHQQIGNLRETRDLLLTRLLSSNINVREIHK